MHEPTMMETRRIDADTALLGAYMPVPGFGVLPVNAFLIKSRQPVLVDTGLKGLREDFMTRLRQEIDPADLRWIWLTHIDPDHIGNLEAVLAEAPDARIVTTYLGMGKLGLNGLPVDRAYLLNPGQTLDVGDRRLAAITPPSFDAPETTGLFDAKSGHLYSADSFGALMEAPAETANDIHAEALAQGAIGWATVDAPWLHMVSNEHIDTALNRLRALAPSAVLGSHLPPAHDMLDTLSGHLAQARTAPAFVGPDQAALERMMAAA